MEDTRYGELMKRLKNNKVIVWLLLFFALIVGLSQFLDAGKNIKEKLVSPTQESIEKEERNSSINLTTRKTEKGKQLLTIFILDKSMSMGNSKISLNPIELEKYIVNSNPAFSQFGVIKIQENSKNQEPFLSDIIEIKENFPAMRRNQILDKLKQISNTLINIINEPPKENASDIRGAIELAQSICEQDIYKNYEIRLIIHSDMIEENKKLYRKIEPINFPNQTNIFIIGSTLTNFQTLFPPNQKIKILPAFKVEYLNVNE